MTLNLIHFPNFRKTFFGATFQKDVLALMGRIRDEIGCRHIMHAYRHRVRDSAKSFASDLTVVTSAPTGWVARYAKNNYFRIDPLFQEDAPYFRSDVSGLVHDLKRDVQTSKAVAEMFRDADKYGLGNVHIAVSARSQKGICGCSQFSFWVDDLADCDAFIAELRPRLLSLAGKLHNKLCGGSALNASVALLTQRELDCLRWAANGKTDGEIAEILSIARWTVVTYLQNAKIKLNCSNRTSAVATALALGIIDMPDVQHLFSQ
ncbi:MULTISPECIES: helix-turn-helix transcriptional regulator [Ochrobactrum]|uniref:HTH-type quorum sensing-dependent transcriptional regulator VjbR n=1 Tax=Ochrobactrum chromiisoli TaxID=2993941 RepID=A0ABT3QPD9_9HYPH|nr:LuxR family transcriptional regulator [Ochrobactrum chromiisoli]MCX2697476.1 autoinducer binding domain-containing protein [Ochrobactrum chromiisoli]